MPTQKVQKADGPGAMNALQDIISKMKAQAAKGEIDEGLIDQASAILSVNAPAVATPPEMPAEAPAEAGAEEDVEKAMETPDEMPDVEGELESTPEMEATEEEESSIPMPPEPIAQRNFGKKEATMTPQPVRKATATPVSGRPPMSQFTAPNLVFDQVDEMRSKLPAFTKAMLTGSMRQAQQIANNNQTAFDAMMKMAMHQVLTEGGCVNQNINKMGGFDPEELATSTGLKKAFTSASLSGIYLIKLAKLMLPVYAGMVNRVPSQSPQGMGSTQATWKAQLGFGALDLAGGFRTTTEGEVGAVPPTSFLTFNAPFADLSNNDTVTMKAIVANRNYNDALQTSVIKTMAALLKLQEMTLIGHNYAAIDAVTSLTTASGSTTGGTIAAGSYVVGVTALTYEGYLKPSVGGASAKGETTAVYSSQIVTTGSTSSINLTWPAVKGAVAYNLYITTTGGAGSAALFNKQVAINKATITAASTAATTPPTADTTVNASGKEGLLQWCEQSTIYGNVIPEKIGMVDNAGAGLTAGNGGILEFDTIFEQMWDKWQTTPSVMLMSSRQNKTLVGKLMSLNNSALYRIEVGQERGTIAGGAMVTGYTNSFAPFADGTPRFVDIIPHPYMPAGTILFLAEQSSLPMMQESRSFVRDVLFPWTYFPLASNSAVYNYQITTSETVECFNPSPQAALVGVDQNL
jgi:hypothetical protein